MTEENITIDDYTLEFREGLSVLSIEGALSAERVESLKAPILKAMAGAQEVVLRAESFREADIAIVQLLCAACQSARVMKKKVYLEGEGVNEFLAVAESAGFSRDALCYHRQTKGNGNSGPRKGSQG
jgi:anti-anti-sigma regulatory factor